MTKPEMKAMGRVLKRVKDVRTIYRQAAKTTKNMLWRKICEAQVDAIDVAIVIVEEEMGRKQKGKP